MVASVGTEKSKGTKVFSLVGKVNNTGLVEVPMGTTLREIIFGIVVAFWGTDRLKPYKQVVHQVGACPNPIWICLSTLIR